VVVVVVDVVEVVVQTPRTVLLLLKDPKIPIINILQTLVINKHLILNNKMFKYLLILLKNSLISRILIILILILHNRVLKHLLQLYLLLPKNKESRC